METNVDALKYEIEEADRGGTRIKVIGVGGGGCNAVARMVAEGLEGVDFYAMNTDFQALSACRVPNKQQLGAKLTKGLGAGSNPEIGRQAAFENTDEIVEILQGSDMVFVTAGLGGGTGTGAAPVIASLAKELDALTVGVVTKPFRFEGARRMRLAEESLAKLTTSVDTVIAIPNERLLSLVPRGTSFFQACKVADDLLFQAVHDISDLINTTGTINRDFADIKGAMLGMGYARMGTAVASGQNAATEAAREAISCPLFEESNIRGARSILINITGSSRLGFHEVNEACDIVRAAAEFEDAQINFGVTLNETMADSVKITVIATGFQSSASIMERPYVVAPPVVRPEPVVERPAPVVEPEPEPEIQEVAFEAEPDPVVNGEPMLDLDDLDTPAYLRQGRLLN